MKHNEILGLVGDNGGTISNSYASVNANERGSMGGLVALNYLGAVISNSYATGNVYAKESPAGGLVGYNEGTIENSFATGNVTGDGGIGNYLGGLAGLNGANGVITTSYFYEHAQPSVCVGLNEGSVECTPETLGSYFYYSSNAPMTSWDFSTIWDIDVGVSYPCFLWQGGCQAALPPTPTPTPTPS